MVLFRSSCDQTDTFVMKRNSTVQGIVRKASETGLFSMSQKPVRNFYDMVELAAYPSAESFL